MSKLIITSHTKDGADMGKEYKIPKEIRDIMFEHQGMTLLHISITRQRKLILMSTKKNLDTADLSLKQKSLLS